MDGVAQPEALVEAAAQMGMPALALTEHRTMASAMKLCLACKAHGIKPIYGVEMDETDERELRSSKERKAKGLRDYHLTFLAKNAAGVRNLFALVSEAALSGPKARTDLRVVRERGWGVGVIALTGCQGSRFAQALRAGDEQASAWYRALQETFEQVYVEVQAHDVHGQDEVNRLALRFAADHHLPVVVTRDVHYARPEDGRIHDFWVQVGRHAPYGSHAFYLASPEQMRTDAVRLGIPLEALSATVALAEQIEAVDLTSAPHMPTIAGPDGMSSEDYLMRLAYDGFFSLPRAKRSQRYRSRLEHELSVITAKGFAPYFLILEDLLRWARSQGIAVGPGRGSAAGSLVAYLLGITRIDPLEHDLLFERFLNPERTSLPDVDIDVDASRRAEVLRYLAERYGTDRVAQVSNYGREHLRSALKDAMRLLGFPFAQANALTRSIPSKWPDQTDVTLDQIMGLDGQVEEAIERWGKLAVDVARSAGDAIRKVARSEPAVLELAKAFEGLVRSYGVHAGGVVISPVPVVERCPLRAGQGKAVLPVTQWDLQDLEAAGLLKLDVLGLKTLSVIHLAEKMSGLSANGVDPNDPDLYRDLADGHTHGLFQAEGAAVRTIGQQMKPRRFQEVVDLLALARPGPMDARLDDGRTMVEHYLDARASGRMKRVHRSLEPILRKTYGVLVYQEQIMQIGQVMAGYTLAEADLLRRAIGKKKHDEMVKLREDFVKRSVRRGYDRAFAERLFGEIEKFAAYAFNASHSAAYAHLLAQTLYLKQHAPAAFVAAQLTVDASDAEKIAEHLAEAHRLGIPVLPPDVNRSDLGFTLEDYQGRQAIRYGLLAVKGLGEQACRAMIAQRPYTDLQDLLGRSFRRAVTVRHLMALAKAGALDSLAGGDRAQAIRSVNERRTKPEKLPAQISRSIWLQWEKEHLGAYLSGHPAEDLPAGDGMEQGLIGALGGLVIGVRTHRDRKGQEMAFLRLDTVRGVFDVVVFAHVWADARKAWASPGPGRQKLRRKTLALGDRVVVWAKRDETGKLLAERLRPAWHICANDGDVPASRRREEAVSV